MQEYLGKWVILLQWRDGVGYVRPVKSWDIP
jgi:hypothetical protein